MRLNILAFLFGVFLFSLNVTAQLENPSDKDKPSHRDPSHGALILETMNVCSPDTIPKSCNPTRYKDNMCACCPVMNGTGGSRWTCMGTIDAEMCSTRAPRGGSCWIKRGPKDIWNKIEK